MSEDEGIGFFRDTRLIYNVPKTWADSVVHEEVRLLKIANELSLTAEEYEIIASLLEHPNPIDGKDLPASQMERIPTEIVDYDFSREDSPVDGLDLGVAGTVCALSAAGLMTAASCRTHAERSWADSPIVYFCSDESHMRTLLPMVKAVGCGLGVSEPLFFIYAQSVAPMSELAQLILGRLGEFGAPVFQWEHERKHQQLMNEIGPNQLAFPDI